MQGKEKFVKIMGSICNIPLEVANTCNILPWTSDSSGLTLVKLKQNLKYRKYVYFEPVNPNVMYRALNYLKIQ